MKSSFVRRVVVFAAASVISTASAQTATFSIVPSQTVVNTTVATSFTLSVFGSASFGTHIEGTVFDLLTAGPLGNGITNITPTFPAWSTASSWGGHIGNGELVGYTAGQVIFPPNFLPHPDTDFRTNPVLLGVFELDVAAGSSGTVNWMTSGGVSGNGEMRVYDEVTGTTMQFITGGPAVIAGSASVTFVPAPSSLGVLGVGGLVVGRRRR